MSTETLWIITLVLGLVVAVVAWVLLQLFYTQVRRIEAHSLRVWETGKQVARNTATTWQLGALSAELGGLEEEVSRHEALLRATSPGLDSPPPEETLT